MMRILTDVICHNNKDDHGGNNSGHDIETAVTDIRHGVDLRVYTVYLDRFPRPVHYHCAAAAVSFHHTDDACDHLPPCPILYDIKSEVYGSSME